MIRVLSLALLLAGLPLAATPITGDVLAQVLAVARAEGVPESVARALMHEESQGDALAESIRVRGYRSVGLFQLYEAPGNLGQLLSKFWYPREEWTRFDIRDPIHNAKIAMRYLSALHRQYGSWYRALCFYNCGNIRFVPEETREYAARIIHAN